jgi:hypothetical protein
LRAVGLLVLEVENELNGIQLRNLTLVAAGAPVGTVAARLIAAALAAQISVDNVRVFVRHVGDSFLSGFIACSGGFVNHHLGR